jgi:hydrogenase expression/formation protein HypE
MALEEPAIPVREQVRAACELLGLDALHVANEGKLCAVCPPEQAQALLAAMRAHPLGRDAALIGEVIEDASRFVRLRTPFGGTRIVTWLAGDQLPRIC